MKIALVAHDRRKPELVEWVTANWAKLKDCDLVCTGTTGRLVEEKLRALLDDAIEDREISLTRLRSGPLGGDQQLGAMIAEGKIDFFVFLWDPMTPQPHDVDVKALLRIATMYNVPTACNGATADFLISSPLFGAGYQRKTETFDDYVDRPL
ncbi:MAG: methylglyoxal synthase [Bacteroidetes bacterium]|nr:MAG: methylglyoxal synthase [Bacteroidota bacterium]